MGLIRKMLFVSTGVVRPNSKKQRVAKATLRATRDQARSMREIAASSRPGWGPTPGWYTQQGTGQHFYWDGSSWVQGA